MIIPAVIVKDKIEELVKEHYYTDKMLYYTGEFGSYPFNIAESTEDGRYDWAIMSSDNRVIGYIGYRLDWVNLCAHNFGMYCFEENNPEFGIGVKEVLDKLFSYNLHRIEWRMVGGNPVEKHYDRFCKRYGGNKVVLHDVIKDQYGKWHDAMIYEIINERAE